MKKKIEWYQEVLSLEPGSKVFFALAKLFVDTDQLDAAAKTLRQGLDRHPDFLEARLLLTQVLSRLGRHGEAAEAASPALAALRSYPAFWKAWAASAKDNADLAVALLVVSSSMTRTPLGLSDVLREGASALLARELASAMAAPVAQAMPAPAPEEPQEPGPEAVDGEEDWKPKDSGSLRTRTMADLLASQGDFSGAGDIYRELFANAASDEEREELELRIAKMDAELRGEGEGIPPREAARFEDAFSRHAKNRLISTLETLAARFEARVRA